MTKQPCIKLRHIDLTERVEPQPSSQLPGDKAPLPEPEEAVNQPDLGLFDEEELSLLTEVLTEDPITLLLNTEELLDTYDEPWKLDAPPAPATLDYTDALRYHTAAA